MENNTDKIIVFGASGMLGNSILRCFHESGIDVFGTLRDEEKKRLLPDSVQDRLISNISADDLNSFETIVKEIKPSHVINCIGVIKQNNTAQDPIKTIFINSILPHQLYQICKNNNVKLIHMSTDCVFSGKKGNYSEDDISDCYDLYGKSKFLGEINCDDALTIRTSIIGHELNSNLSLIDWFLNQQGHVKGYKKAIFSGMPTIEIAKILRDFVIPNFYLTGIAHLAAKPINKYELLKLVAKTYKKNIKLIEDNTIIIDRSLNGSYFERHTGYKPKPWRELIENMKSFG